MTGTSSRWWLRSDSEEIVVDAPAEVIYEKFGITAVKMVEEVKRLLKRAA